MALTAWLVMKPVEMMVASFPFLRNTPLPMVNSDCSVNIDRGAGPPNSIFTSTGPT